MIRVVSFCSHASLAPLLGLDATTQSDSLVEQPVEVRQRRDGAHAGPEVDGLVRVRRRVGLEAPLLQGQSPLPPRE